LTYQSSTINYLVKSVTRDIVRGHPSVSLLPLSSPILPYSPLVYMYFHHHLQGPHSKADDLRTHSPTTLQKLTPGCRQLPASPPALTSTASDELRTHWDRSAWHYGTLHHHVDTHIWEAWY
jgi:hypothetical protein